jgi:hypothetical protein
MTLEQGENEQIQVDNAQSTDAEGDSKRERSTIGFAYNDLDDAVAVARTIHTNAGTSCTLSQLAALLGQPISSGTFRARLSNAAVFGLTENARREVSLTALGRRIADPAAEPAARVDAFLHVPLYQRIFGHHDGYTLPGAAPLEKFMREVGVSPKQTGKARQAFMRSARQAGFFAHGEDRLVQPSFPDTPSTRPVDPAKENEKVKSQNGGGGGDDLPPLDGLILALVKKLPPIGTKEWNIQDRVMWLQMAAMAFQMAYGSVGPIEIKSGDDNN